MRIKPFYGYIALLAITIAGFAQVKLRPAYPDMNMPLDVPTDIQHAGDGSGRLFVSQRSGLIYVFPGDSSATSASVFLDIEDRVTPIENLGLLSFAFDPDYSNTGLFYVKYSQADGDSFCNVIARFAVTADDPNRADHSSEQRLMKIPQVTFLHGGGSIAFGPHDDFLYITTGDGGPDLDPKNNAQNLERLLGKVLCIDVAGGGLGYAIPPDNPFAGNTAGYREEIFAYGFRNPWRLSIDPITHRIWLGDVGSSTYEEIDIVESGKNYGWRVMVGAHCLPPITGCDTTGLVLPVWEYDHPGQNGSITGGYEYRGSQLNGLQGQYIYGDFNTGRIWALDISDIAAPVNALLLDSEVLITSFGVDESGEMVLCAAGNNEKLYRILPDVTGMIAEDHFPASFVLGQNYPNPFNPITAIRYRLSAISHVNLVVYNALGKQVRTLENARQSPGWYSVIWDGRTDVGRPVASGIYYYRLRSKGKQQTRAMHLLR